MFQSLEMRTEHWLVVLELPQQCLLERHLCQNENHAFPSLLLSALQLEQQQCPVPAKTAQTGKSLPFFTPFNAHCISKAG